MTSSVTFKKPYLYYSASLFLVSVVLLALFFRLLPYDQTISPGTIAFFLVLNLYTISVGYPHPVFGHVSFDRVGQVASILVLGPIVGAAIALIASFCYPFYRLLKGVSLVDVVTASLHNAGLMCLAVLSGGLFYTLTGGSVPMDVMSLGLWAKLIGLMVVMQLINELGMLVYMYSHGGNPRTMVSAFSTSVEIVSGFIGVLVAAVFNRLEVGTFVLLLLVLSMGMLVLRRYALMRNRLELLVEERTAELEQKTRELELKATHDKLTGLYNRRYADDYLEREIESAIRYQENFTVALADIDHFKQVNDRHSHEVGDLVLQSVAQMLETSCRATDTIARYGGEEFLLCFPRTNASDAHALCEKLRQTIEQHSWDAIAPTVSVTLSFGVAQIDVNSRRKTILREADEHLYVAKNLGRNRVVA